MKICILIICFFVVIQIEAQPYVPSEVVNIHNVEDILYIAKTNGFKELEKSISPINIIHVDSTYAPILIDLEFESEFWNRCIDKKEIITYELPEFSLELAYNFNNLTAGERLFDYYCTIPKHCKADTIYYIYNNLDDFLKVLVKYSSPQLIERLKQDYIEWTKLAENSPKKIYPSIEEIGKTSFEESMKFKANDLYVDCNFLVLQIAAALNFLEVEGFDNTLIAKLKTMQTYPFAYKYSFPKPIILDTKAKSISCKTVLNSTQIVDFGKDYEKVEKLIFDNIENCWESRVSEIIENGSKAYVSLSRNNGSDFYTLQLNSDNTIVINLISSIIY
ncbi:MAG: hypothetical protein IPO21_01375 [Bacteroidales bacterium]|nr:hypothetical protein [Bacteroidales bacterium]